MFLPTDFKSVVESHLTTSKIRHLQVREISDTEILREYIRKLAEKD